MKNTLPLFKIIFLLAIVFISNTAFVTGEPVLTIKDKQNCQQFQSLKGLDRLQVFQKIQPLIRVTDRNSNSHINMMGANLTTQEEIINVLGNPDEILEGGFLQYNLKPSPTDCKVVICFNKNNQVVFCTIKDCN